VKAIIGSLDQLYGVDNGLSAATGAAIRNAVRTIRESGVDIHPVNTGTRGQDVVFEFPDNMEERVRQVASGIGKTQPEPYVPGGIYQGISLNEAMLRQALQGAYGDVDFVTSQVLVAVASQRISRLCQHCGQEPAQVRCMFCQSEKLHEQPFTVAC
jgi:hypothetical protein